MKPCCEEYLNGQFGGDAELVAEIYGEYVSSLKAKLAEAASALAAGQWEALDRAAHTVKGNALAAGDEETAETGIALRRAAKLNDAAESRSLLAKLEALAEGL